MFRRVLVGGTVCVFAGISLRQHAFCQPAQVWQEIWHAGDEGRRRLVQVMAKVNLQTKSEVLVPELVRTLLFDADIYRYIRALNEGVVKPTHDINELNARAQVRGVNKASELLKLCEFAAVDLSDVKLYVDVGCADGSTAAALGAKLALPKASIHGVDSETHKDTTFQVDGLTYHDWDLSGHRLPFPSASLDLVTCCQVLHHREDADEVILEFSRILKPGGVLILREHDVDSRLVRLLCDVEHGVRWHLFAKVSTTGAETNLPFGSEINYASFAQWDSKLRSCGMHMILHHVPRDDWNPTNIGHMIYIKPLVPAWNTAMRDRPGW